MVLGGFTLFSGEVTLPLVCRPDVAQIFVNNKVSTNLGGVVNETGAINPSPPIRVLV